MAIEGGWINMPITLILAFLIIVALYFLTKPKPKPHSKIPTIEDIRRKYPKRKSQEQLKAESLRARQEDYDRKLAERMSLQGMAKAQKVKQREISINSFKTLIRMVNGDEAIARRLIEGNIKNYPEKSPTWACDKAISDLERDRRI
jgi:hypothetical protein